MNVFQAINRMRTMSDNNVPFAIEFLTCNTTKGTSKGLKVVSRCLLRTGLSSEHSDKSNILIAYTDLDTDKPGFFYIPLLLKLNNTDIE